MNRIAITGGAGFIGSCFLRHILEYHPDYEVVIVDKFTYAGNPDNIKGLLYDERITLVVGDICDRWTLDHLEGVTHIVNFAAETFVDTSIHSDQDPFVRTNVQGVMNLLRWLSDKDIRYVQVGTDEVYGDTPLGSTRKFQEHDRLEPNNPYSATKAGADHLVHAFVHTYGVNACTTRCSNNYGPRQFPEKLIPRMIKRALKNQSVPVYAKGENIRDWIHVEDHCHAIDVVMHLGKSGEVYNVGGDAERRNIDVVTTILDILEKPHDLIEYVEDRPGHDLRYAIDSGLMARMFGWKPGIRFEKGLERTVEWYVKNQEWMDRIESGSYRRWAPDDAIIHPSRQGGLL